MIAWGDVVAQLGAVLQTQSHRTTRYSFRLVVCVAGDGSVVSILDMVSDNFGDQVMCDFTGSSFAWRITSDNFLRRRDLTGCGNVKLRPRLLTAAIRV